MSRKPSRPRPRIAQFVSVAPIVVLLCFDGGPAFQRGSDPWLPGTVQVPAFRAEPFNLVDREAQVKALTARYIAEEFKAFNVQVVTDPRGVRSATVVYFGGRDFSHQGRIGLATLDPGNRHRNNYAFVFTDDVHRHMRKADLFRLPWDKKTLTPDQLARLLANIACHELGHTFGLADGDEGLMDRRMELKPVRRPLAPAEHRQLMRLLGPKRKAPEPASTAVPVSEPALPVGRWHEGRIAIRGGKAAFTYRSDLEGVVSVMVYASKRDDLYPNIRAELLDGADIPYVIEPRNPYSDIRIDQKNVHVHPDQTVRIVVADRGHRAPGRFWVRLNVAKRLPATPAIAQVGPSSARQIWAPPVAPVWLSTGAAGSATFGTVEVLVDWAGAAMNDPWWRAMFLDQQRLALQALGRSASRLVGAVLRQDIPWPRLLLGDRLADRRASGTADRPWR